MTNTQQDILKIILKNQKQPDTDLGLLQHPRWVQAVNDYHKALHLGCCSSPRPPLQTSQLICTENQWKRLYIM